MNRYIALFSLIIIGCSLWLVENVVAMEDKPEIFMSQVYMGSGPGVRRLGYGSAYLPEAISRVKTTIDLLEFKYPSFDQVEVKIVFRNIAIKNSPEQRVYEDSEKWKAEATFFPDTDHGLYPFLCLFLKDTPAEHVNIEDVKVYSKITDFELLDENASKVKFERLFNRIVYLPDSYFKLFTPPDPEKQKYRIFAGHNLLLYLPLSEKKYTLTFRIHDYHPEYTGGIVKSIVPLVFFTNHVEIKKYVVDYSGKAEVSLDLFKPASPPRAINPNVPMISGFRNRIVAGERARSLSLSDLEYDGTLLLWNQHLLTPKETISIGYKSIDCPLPLSIYDLLKKNKNVLVPPAMEYFVLNTGASESDITVRTEILELSQPDIQKVRVRPGEIKTVIFAPTFIYEKVERVRVSKEFTVYCSCRDSAGAMIEERTFNIRVLPQSTMLWSMLDESTGLSQWYFDYIVNWVTPHIDSKKADEVLRSSLERMALKAFAGYNDSLFTTAQSNGLFKTKKDYVRDIVKSLYDSVSDLKPRYSNETIDFGRSGNQEGQKIRYPKETLEQGRGNCIDSTVMFASMLEQIGLYPMIVIVPGHAFVGWETWENSGEYEYLEMTMVGYQDFDAAYKSGMETERKYLAGKSFDFMPRGPNEVSPTKVYIKKVRETGIYTRD